jgi:protein-arginine kinase activator protein McsA
MQENDKSIESANKRIKDLQSIDYDSQLTENSKEQALLQEKIDGLRKKKTSYLDDMGDLKKSLQPVLVMLEGVVTCPNCKTEFKMNSKGTEIFCTECGKRWHMNENCSLTALEGETEFSHIPDWYLWERENVKKEIEEGKYYYEDTVDVFGEPRTQGFVSLGKAKITHDVENGWIIEGNHNKASYRIHRKPLQINSLHVEYDYFRIRRADCFDISTENDSFYCYPTHNNVTKLAFATEISYLMHEEKLKK